MPRMIPPPVLPACLARDAWWLDSPPPGTATPAPDLPRRGPGRVVGLLALIVLGDALFYGQRPGLSLVLYAAAVFAVTLTVAPRGAEWRRPALLLAVAALPVIDHAQPLAVLFLLAGLLVAIVWARRPSDLAAGVLGLLRHLPLAGPRALMAGIRQRGLWRGWPRPAALWRGWALPLGGTLILIALLSEANPILSGWLNALRLPDVDLGALLRRAMFWVGLALVVWPLLLPAPPRALPALPRLPGTGFTAEAVRRGLILFNAALLLQTGLDAVYLWGGAALPPGMSAAEYAHRGAYPLLATALLAGAFALAARPFLAEQRFLRPLMALWLGQNIALTLSALLRLDHYVALYGLTYLRAYAAIWMGLVALGLGLTFWQIWRGRSNRWLLMRCTGLGLATLYACCFVNFAAVVARVNLSRSMVDLEYTCGLGPMAAAEMARAPLERLCVTEAPQIADWREWGFRGWRVSRYIGEAPGYMGWADENPRGR